MTVQNLAPSKHVFLQTFGCQMNERDSEGVKGLLLDRGYTFTDDIDRAQVILFNTCSVRQHAEDRVFGRSGILANIKKARPDTVIGVMGCMAQEHGESFFRRIPSLDLVCGPGNIADIPDILDRVALGGARRVTAIDKINDPEYTMDRVLYRSHRVRASVNIMSGCDHKCTYCIVPMTRGIERSRPSDDIVREVRDLAARGFKDILLLGQNVNCYGKKLDEGTDFAELLRKIDREAAPERVRFTTSHPKDAHLKLFETMRDTRSVCEHLHLPVQSGSSKMLRRMKREHTREWYLDRIAEYKKTVPHGSLTTDLITGFCGETDADFEETKKLLLEAEFDSAYIFKYSVRPGTPAERLPDDVPEDVKHARLQELLELQRAVTFSKNSRLIGTEAEVLFEEENPETPARSSGRTRTYKRVVVQSPENLEGQSRRVRIRQVLNETLIGDLLEA
jgi:tRNA-2-methylthio-N6-dimethylallyladenosine synthase